MLKILIVENDITIRKGLIKLIADMNLPLGRAMEADNGKQGLAVTAKYCPDIIITDIKMPIMDGLEMIKEIRHKGMKNIKIIIISGYSDFAYAQEALEYNVVGYLLKSIKTEKLQNALEKAIDQYYREKSDRTCVVKANIQAEAYKTLVLKEMLLGTARGKKIVNEIENIMPDYKSRKFFIVKISTDIDYQQIISNIKLCAGEDIRIETSYITMAGEFVFLLSFNHLNDEVYFNLIAKLQEASKLYAGISNAEKNIKSASTLLERASEALDYRIVLPDKIICYNDLNIKYDTHEHISIYLKQVLDTLNNNDIGGSFEELENLFHAIKNTPNIRPKIVRNCVEAIVASLEGETKYSESLNTKINNIYQKSNSLFDLKIQIKEMMLKKMSTVKNAITQINNGAYIAKAIEYINKNYNKEIQLEDIADKVGIHPVYLSSLFKKRSGLTFTEYLSSVRINKAKELLKTTRLKILEISSEVGMAEKYFCRSFKKICGQTPGEYRRQHWI